MQKKKSFWKKRSAREGGGWKRQKKAKAAKEVDL